MSKQNIKVSICSQYQDMTEDVGDSLDIVISVQAWKSILPMKELEVFKTKKDSCEDWKPASTAEHPHLYKSGKGEF